MTERGAAEELNTRQGLAAIPLRPPHPLLRDKDHLQCFLFIYPYSCSYSHQVSYQTSSEAQLILTVFPPGARRVEGGMSSPSSTSAPHFTYRTVASESAHSSTVDAFPPPGPPPLYGNIPLSADIARRILEQNQEKQEVRDRERAMLLASPAIRPPREASSGSRESSTPSDDSAEAVNTDDSTQPTSEASGGGSRILVNGEPVYRDSMDSAATGSTDACLPEGLGVKEALAQCEDPTLGWSQQFWITIADPNVSCALPRCIYIGRDELTGLDWTRILCLPRNRYALLNLAVRS